LMTMSAAGAVTPQASAAKMNARLKRFIGVLCMVFLDC